MFRLTTQKLSCFHFRIISRNLSNTFSEKNPQILPTSADVVVIGGGSAGCNTLYQLARRGVNAILLERAKLTSGTTWHTAGLIWRLRPSDVEIELLRTTRDTLMRLESETGLDPGWINNGGLYISHSKERENEYSRLSTLGKGFGIESQILDPLETQKVFPLLNPKSFDSSLYSPGDGVVDPAMMCNALKKFSTSNGAKVFEDCPVTYIQTAQLSSGNKSIVGVVTKYGIIKTNCIINCTGAWARELMSQIDLELPLIPMKHAYIVSNSIPGVKGMPNVRDHDASIYFRIQGESICMGGYESNPYILQEVPADFQFGLYELDWSLFESHLAGAVSLCPKFQEVGIKSTVCGPESFTPDHKPIMGEDPRINGLFHNCGFNSAGMMLGAGCGEQIALWVINGRPNLHMFAYDIRRFTPTMVKNKEWIKERSHESYAKNYSIVFPHDESLAGRNLITDPLHDEMLEVGAIMEERQGFERPGYFKTDGRLINVPPYDWYGNYGVEKNDGIYKNQLELEYTFGFPKTHELISKEALACRNKVVVFNLSYYCKLYLSGPDAQKAADWLFTANTQKETNKIVYTCALNRKGGVEADVTVTAQQDGPIGCEDFMFKGRGFYIVAGGASGYQTWVHMNSTLRKRNFRVQLNDITDKLGILSIQGPRSRDVMEMLTHFTFPNEEFPVSTARFVNINGHECLALRVSFVGELGYELHIPKQSMLIVYKKIMEVGKAFGLKNAGFRAMYALSLEKGYHLWSFDLRIDDNPIEANLGFTCRKDGEYLGKRAVEKMRSEGITKRLVFFTVSKETALWGLESIWRNGVIVGHLRRGDFGFHLDKSIGVGYVKHHEEGLVTKDYLESGNYEIEVMGEKFPATLHLRSPFDPKNNRLSGIYDHVIKKSIKNIKLGP